VPCSIVHKHAKNALTGDQIYQRYVPVGDFQHRHQHQRKIGCAIERRSKRKHAINFPASTTLRRSRIYGQLNSNISKKLCFSHEQRRKAPQPWFSSARSVFWIFHFNNLRRHHHNTTMDSGNNGNSVVQIKTCPILMNVALRSAAT